MEAAWLSYHGEIYLMPLLITALWYASWVDCTRIMCGQSCRMAHQGSRSDGGSS